MDENEETVAAAVTTNAINAAVGEAIMQQLEANFNQMEVDEGDPDLQLNIADLYINTHTQNLPPISRSAISSYHVLVRRAIQKVGISNHQLTTLRTGLDNQTNRIHEEFGVPFDQIDQLNGFNPFGVPPIMINMRNYIKNRLEDELAKNELYRLDLEALNAPLLSYGFIDEEEHEDYEELNVGGSSEAGSSASHAAMNRN